MVRYLFSSHLRQICNFLDAVRVKYRLASHLYDDFFKFHLGPKLGDFLVEERRHDSVKNARKQAKLALSVVVTQALGDD
jgi:hypothetical protein